MNRLEKIAVGTAITAVGVSSFLVPYGGKQTVYVDRPVDVIREVVKEVEVEATVLVPYEVTVEVPVESVEYVEESRQLFSVEILPFMEPQRAIIVWDYDGDKIPDLFEVYESIITPGGVVLLEKEDETNNVNGLQAMIEGLE